MPPILGIALSAQHQKGHHAHGQIPHTHLFEAHFWGCYLDLYQPFPGFSDLNAKCVSPDLNANEGSDGSKAPMAPMAPKAGTRSAGRLEPKRAVKSQKVPLQRLAFRGSM